jgi:hypothetical protein
MKVMIELLSDMSFFKTDRRFKQCTNLKECGAPYSIPALNPPLDTGKCAGAGV